MNDADSMDAQISLTERKIEIRRTQMRRHWRECTEASSDLAVRATFGAVLTAALVGLILGVTSRKAAIPHARSRWIAVGTGLMRLALIPQVRDFVSALLVNRTRARP